MKNFEIFKISAKSMESWENFVLLGNKRLVCNFSELKLILPSVKSAKTLTSTAFYLKDHSRGHVISKLIEIGG